MWHYAYKHIYDIYFFINNIAFFIWKNILIIYKMTNTFWMVTKWPTPFWMVTKWFYQQLRIERTKWQGYEMTVNPCNYYHKNVCKVSKILFPWQHIHIIRITLCSLPFRHSVKVHTLLFISVYIWWGPGCKCNGNFNKRAMMALYRSPW